MPAATTTPGGIKSLPGQNRGSRNLDQPKDKKSETSGREANIPSPYVFCERNSNSMNPPATLRSRQVMGKRKVLIGDRSTGRKMQCVNGVQQSSIVPAHLLYYAVVYVDSEIVINSLGPTVRMAIHSDSYTLHKVLPNKVDPLVSLVIVEKVPDNTYRTHPQLFQALGIAQPNGALIYGAPGTGKLSWRVLSKQVQKKYIGDGSRMWKWCGGDSEIQRTTLGLLNQLSGLENIKVVMAMNGIGYLDSAYVTWSYRSQDRVAPPGPEARLHFGHSLSQNIFLLSSNIIGWARSIPFVFA
ncbi:hypothetical protein BDZ97DRAFT_1754061 [Flammula alnicola]|nr:hypothetical protein BDZ97DRAFT_1754061 [Flammula alnicola]